MATPVYDSSEVCIATLCLVTPREDGQRNRARYLATLGTAAEDLSARLGYPGGNWGVGQPPRQPVARRSRCRSEGSAGTDDRASIAVRETALGCAWFPRPWQRR